MGFVKGWTGLLSAVLPVLLLAVVFIVVVVVVVSGRGHFRRRRQMKFMIEPYWALVSADQARYRARSLGFRLRAPRSLRAVQLDGY